ncbi:hypothetical protein [Schaalia suimastitidis]|nr:hypothetical protein [Schaalia suimastitidis]
MTNPFLLQQEPGGDVKALQIGAGNVSAIRRQGGRWGGAFTG